MKKVFLVTGCNGGIGKAICEKIHKKGHIIVGTGLHTEENPYVDCFIQANLTNSTEHSKIISTINSTYAQLDGIIHVAAVQICKPIWEMEEHEWDKIYDCNVKTVFLFVKYAIELLKSSQGTIISIGSVHGTATSDQIAGYGSSKAAIVGLTRNLAIELGKFNINVNCVSPGAVDTPMLRDGLSRGHVEGGTSDELVEGLGKKHLCGRVGNVNEIASLVEYLSDKTKSEFITGANFIIDGGATIKLSTE